MVSQVEVQDPACGVSSWESYWKEIAPAPATENLCALRRENMISIILKSAGLVKWWKGGLP